MARMDYLRSAQRFAKPRRHLSRWVWLGVAAALGVFGFGILANNPATSQPVAWQWEQARAWTRDTFVRRSDTLPAVSPAPDGDTVSPLAPADAPTVSASYVDRAHHADYSATRPRDVPDQAGQAEAAAPVVEPLPTPVTFDLVEPPAAFELTGFKHEYQGINNCGPTTLAMDLRFWGWEGDQYTISNVLKPIQRDKNVRWDELVFYVKTHAGWLDALFRVDGDFETVQLFVANGYPVIIETGYYVNNVWVGHYLLVTGYDREAATVVVQDATGGPNRVMTFEEVDALWQQFNRLYILVFPAGKRAKIEYMLGQDAYQDVNRERALLQAEADIEADPDNAFAWFNYGSNLDYFDRYDEAATAFDKAREIGLPWRMLFYQFGPYIAYFNVGRYQDVEDLATATLEARPDLEESYVWRGWARHMLGDTQAGIADFKAALLVNPNFNDAITALDYFGAK